MKRASARIVPAVDLAQFGALVHVFKEQVAMADGLVVTHEEIEVVAV